jgi:hypothetical protein
MLQNVNDSLSDAKQLGQLLSGEEQFSQRLVQKLRIDFLEQVSSAW